MTTKSAAAKKAPAKSAAKKTAHKTATKAPAKTAAKKSAAKKTAKSAAKKTTTPRVPRPRGEVDVKMIQTVDSAPGRDTRVYFTDGSNALVKRDSALDKMLSRSESHAPGMVKVSVDHGQITGAEPVKVDQATPDDTPEDADSAS